MLYDQIIYFDTDFRIYKYGHSNVILSHVGPMVQTDSIVLRCLQIVFNHFTDSFFLCLLVLYNLLGLPELLI